MTESDEIADQVNGNALAAVKSFDDARIIAKKMLFADESQQLIDNLAESILRRAKCKAA